MTQSSGPPRSPFAAHGDLLDDTPIRAVTAAELERVLEAHALYLDSDRKAGARAQLDSTDLSGRSLAGRRLRRARLGLRRRRDSG